MRIQDGRQELRAVGLGVRPEKQQKTMRRPGFGCLEPARFADAISAASSSGYP